ncbi:MAG: 50S ribosomal protein L17 [Candidatus Magasanikbacteria bacterium CG10_big_fil_rev_8_21_14_0_10_40_10]|uniref:Large ribosomal subunit protein bL17 n=1 Tax=Candidatus Magasanikbacteria bacterium CG10_big_fil_rev_8_21_14_0_10_40_10 TaxID=1974648 RepID=A0A2M6W513_9BACT|nr:MAG: 50S ribosomal protein L17 [Candidatus Magasanikbacteria bacterium CG10_big_fil_rev_8_21_14_0_10_40_10]
MRHQKKKTTLDRKSDARQALLINLAESLIFYEKIKTTQAKAKALRPVVEKLITKAKENTLASRRELGKKLFTNNAIKKLRQEIAPKYAQRAGGYTRITKLPNRPGDGALQAIIEFV